VCRIYDVDPAATYAPVEAFAELGGYFDMPVSSYSSGMRSRLAFALSLAVDFDCYLIDETIGVGDFRFQAKCQAALAERRARAAVIMVSHSDALIRRMCDAAAVLAAGRLTLFDDVEAAIAAYRKPSADPSGRAPS
jgi:capsular polysaccharide transport system ATP-binding protein